MATNHSGNIENQILQEEHDGSNNAKRVNVVAGGAGLATVQPLAAWPDPKTYIGLVTITGSLAPAAGNVTLDPGSKTQIVGNVTLSDPKGFIGLVTVVGSLSPAAGNVTLDPGSKTGIVGNVTLSDAKTFIGLTTTTLGSSIAGIGFATVNVANSVGIAGNVTLSDAKTFIGLVTATALIAGTTKTLLRQPIGFSVASQATIAVPTNANKINVTQLVLNSDATTSVRIKSGVTYLTGNASIGVTLNPGGGWVMPGSVDSPAWIGLPSGALIIEKFDLTGTSAKIGGGVVYFDEA